jgi:hypothetical protein
LGVGGLFYTATVSRILVERLGINGMTIYGGIVIAIQLAAGAFSLRLALVERD